MCTKKEEQRYSKCEICGVLIDDTDKVYITHTICAKNVNEI
ncbi:hypothetical protein [Clostridioides difficile]|nr:hypothetical protein [Clostridioides difficile]EQL05755.1 hypothetical protein QE1_3559 [Clostridioides difficile CD86]